MHPFSVLSGSKQLLPQLDIWTVRDEKTLLPQTAFKTMEETVKNTARNQLHLPLLSLPGEIRNNIYKYAVGGHVVVVEQKELNKVDLDCCVLIPSTSLASYTDPTCLLQPGQPRDPLKCVSQLFSLGLVCKQLYAETTLLQYRLNIFQFGCEFALISFASKLSEDQLNAITEISAKKFLFKNTLYRYRDQWFQSALFRNPFPKLTRFYMKPGLAVILKHDSKSVEKVLEREKVKPSLDYDSSSEGFVPFEVVILNVLDPTAKIQDATTYTAKRDA